MCGGKQWRVTDVGTRVVVAIDDQHEDMTWTLGPPYVLAEHVFDENDLPVCEVLT